MLDDIGIEKIVLRSIKLEVDEISVTFAHAGISRVLW